MHRDYLANFFDIEVAPALVYAVIQKDYNTVRYLLASPEESRTLNGVVSSIMPQVAGGVWPSILIYLAAQNYHESIFSLLIAAGMIPVSGWSIHLPADTIVPHVNDCYVEDLKRLRSAYMNAKLPWDLSQLPPAILPPEASSSI